MSAEDFNTVEFDNQELDDTISCCICTNVYTDPKALPCTHTFCMKCLQEIGLKTNKGPDDEMPCPICRRQFRIPQEGFCTLPTNCFITKLIQVANLSHSSASSTTLCDACLEDENVGKETPTADMCCSECKQNLCEECCRHHRKLKLTKHHKLMPIIECQESDENVVANLAPSICEFHEQRLIEIYCADCKTVVCAMCFIDDHNNHKGSHVNKFVEGFRKQIENNIETINHCSFETQMKKEELIKIKEDMQQKVGRLESDVLNRRDELKQFADYQADSLLQSLCSIRQIKSKEIQMEDGDIDALLSCLQSYSSYCQKMMAKGSASDICRTVSDLSVRAIELQQQSQSLTEREILPFKFSFTKSEFDEFLEDDNFIGEIEEECNSRQKKANTLKVTLIKELSNKIDLLKQQIEMERREKESFRLENEQLNITLRDNAEKLNQELESQKTLRKTLQVDNDKLRQELDTERSAVKHLLKSKEQENEDREKTKTAELRYKLGPVSVQTIRTKAAENENKSITGLTIFDKELFVVCEMSSEVEVYDSTKFSFIRRWQLNELIHPWGIASCNRNKCLYIFDSKRSDQSKEILRVDSNGKLIKKWSTGNDYGWGLSVTDESNVILTCTNRNMLNEYSSDGQLISEINLSSYPGIFHPLHAIKLISGHFMLSHGCDDDELCRVCVVDGDGNLKKSFGGSTFGLMDLPVCLAIDGNGFVMVADQENRRVLLLDSDLEFKSIILSVEKHGLRDPTNILLDQKNNRLFVADNEWDPDTQMLKDGRILIFDFV